MPAFSNHFFKFQEVIFVSLDSVSYFGAFFPRFKPLIQELLFGIIV